MNSSSLIRNSASLIVLARNTKLSSNGYNYKILAFKRTEKTSFMANHIVFPGGACDPPDQSKDWINHFKKFGITESRLQEISKINGNRPPIFQTTDCDPMKREVSLRITAIRETFEELGILICRKKHELQNSDLFGRFFQENVSTLRAWQEIVHNDPTKFLELCQKFDIVPDLWSLYEWSVWMTPSIFKKRFETAFFVVALNDVPQVIPEPHEVHEYFWKTPLDYLSFLKDEQFFLPPPQVYEFSRISKFTDITELTKFAKQRNNKGVTLFLPVQHRCSDGMVGVLPGDSAYPKNPYDVESILDHSDETLEEFRDKSENLHRSEHRSFHDIKYFLNFKPFDDHISPVLESSKL